MVNDILDMSLTLRDTLPFTISPHIQESLYGESDFAEFHPADELM
jgi:hypothetical protein